MSSMSVSSNSKRFNKKVKTPMEIRPKPMDLMEDYDAFFPIYSEEEGKRFSSLCKRSICIPMYFDDQLLKDMGMYDIMNLMCKRLGWFKVKTVKYDMFYE